jgi:hypothetical protein
VHAELTESFIRRSVGITDISPVFLLLKRASAYTLLFFVSFFAPFL